MKITDEKAEAVGKRYQFKGDPLPDQFASQYVDPHIVIDKIDKMTGVEKIEGKITFRKGSWKKIKVWIRKVFRK